MTATSPSLPTGFDCSDPDVYAHRFPLEKLTS